MFNFVRKSMLSAAFIVAPVILNACGGDSSSSSAGDEDVITADSTDDLPNCTKSREGTKAVTEEGSFVCVDGTWEPEKEEVPDYDTEEDLPNCTKSREGEIALVKDSGDTLVCKSGEWVEKSKESPKSSDSKTDDDDGETSESSSSADDEEESSSSATIIVVDGKSVDGTCHASPSRVGKDESVEWVFTAGVLDETATAAEIVAYHTLVKTSDCEWTLTGSTEKTVKTKCKDAVATATYATTGNYTASMKVGDKTIDCGKVAVVGAPISGCLCTASETSPDVTNGSVTVTWTVSGCTSEASINGYTWKNATGTSSTATARFSEEDESVTPKVVVGNAENNSMTVSCQSATAIYNHAPVAEGYTATIAETAQSGSFVCDENYSYNCGVSASDANGDELSYAITAGNEDGLFEISSAGRISLVGSLDYETTTSYTLTVTVSDGRGKSATATVEINVTDVDEAPVFEESEYECEIVEGTTSFTSTCSVAATDPEGEPVTYEITGGDAESQFTINASGVLGVAVAPVYSDNPEYDLEVSASDGGETGTVTVHVVVVSNGVSSSAVESSSSEGIDPESSSDGSIYDATANTLTDLRDNQVYRTITIEVPAENYSEVWMAKNLNIVAENSWCGGNDCSVYGRLYTWAAAIGRTEDECGYNHTCEPSGTVRGVCPEGWHLPNNNEWNELFTAVGGSSVAGKVLKSETGWKSSSVIENTDDYLFTALPAGYRNFNGSFDLVGDNAYFWSSTEYNLEEAHYVDLYYSTDYAYLRNYYKDGGISVRCLKD